MHKIQGLADDKQSLLRDIIPCVQCVNKHLSDVLPGATDGVLKGPAKNLLVDQWP